MIKNINKKIEKNELTVEVECSVRKYAKYKINELTTDKLIDILGKEHNITGIKSKPSHRVGNSTRRKMQTTGTWVFSIEDTEKKKIEEKPKTKTTRQRKPRTPAAKKETTKSTPPDTSSIRSRMSKLSK